MGHDEMLRRLEDLASYAEHAIDQPAIAAALLVLLERTDPGPMYCPTVNHIHGPGRADEPLAKPGQVYGADCWLYSDPRKPGYGPMINALTREEA